MGERIAALEARGISEEKAIEELERQKDAMWKKVEELDKIKISLVELQARMEERMSSMEKSYMRDSFSLRGQIAEIGWRVGVIVAVGVLLFNFIISKIDLGDIFGGSPTHQNQKR